MTPSRRLQYFFPRNTSTVIRLTRWSDLHRQFVLFLTNVCSGNYLIHPMAVPSYSPRLKREIILARAPW